MEKIKPEVIGWVQVEYDGMKVYGGGGIIYNSESMADMARFDSRLTNVKSKFRPVYKRKENEKD